MKKEINIDKPDLSQSEEQIINDLPSANSDRLNVVKKVLSHYLYELRDIDNIDRDGNVGLQATSMKVAYRFLEEAMELMFDDIRNQVNEREKEEKKEKTYNTFQ